MRKFRLIDNTSPIKIEANLGELGIEIENYPLTNVWNRKEEIKQFRFIAVDFQYSGIQMVSEIQLENIPKDTKIEFVKRES